jgi:hypothetical protein
MALLVGTTLALVEREVVEELEAEEEEELLLDGVDELELEVVAGDRVELLEVVGGTSFELEGVDL